MQFPCLGQFHWFHFVLQVKSRTLRKYFKGFWTSSNFQYQFSIISIIIVAHILIFRSPSSSSLSASLHSTTAACLCSHVASGSARRCSRLWDAGGVCHHGDRHCARAFELQSEGPTHSGASSKGKRLGSEWEKINMQQDHVRLVSDNNIVDSSIKHPAVKHWLRWNPDTGFSNTVIGP